MDIKSLRNKLGLNQVECARYLGISRRSLQYLESDDADKKTPKYQTYVDLLSRYEEATKRPLFQMSVLLSQDIGLLYKKVSHYKKRFCYEKILNYCNNQDAGRVCILYGLRRTGKTTMLFQLFGDIDINKAAYIKAKEGNSMGDLIKDLNQLRTLGIKYVFVDEITLLDDFISSASSLSDIYAMLGMKIVLSGTDSLGFVFASADELYDRAILIHTSYISFKEFSYLLDINDIDTYIEYGGTLRVENMGYDDPDYHTDEVSFKDDESTRKYIDSAIARNIQRSLRNYRFGERFAHLRSLYEQGELTNVINRIIEDMNHDFLLSVLNKRFKSHDLGSAKQLLLHQSDPNAQTALYDIDEEGVLEKLKELIDIKETNELKVQFGQETLEQIKSYLSLLDLIQEVDIRFDDGSVRKRVVFSQPGMRYSLAKALVFSLLQDPFFGQLEEKSKNIIIEKILDDVKGRMLEDIVLLDSSRSFKEKKVFKFQSLQGGEIDMVCFDPKDNVSDLYEIKHSKAISLDNQAKFLLDERMNRSVSSRFGNVINKFVLYKGTSLRESEIYYQNVEDFLKQL